MKITRLDTVDWEPCILRFGFRLGRFPDVELRTFVDQWLKSDRPFATCRCKYRYSEFLRESVEVEVLKTEWMCEICAQALANAVESRFPTLNRVELGLPASREKNEAQPAFLEVPNKDIEFEDGSHMAVRPFLIARRPVSIRDFEAFVHDTGYVTLAEQQSHADTFRNHCGLSGLSPSVVDTPAQFVAPVDADAFCRHVGSRLPTEAEWLAASVIDPHEMELTPWEELQRRARPLAANALEVNNWEITATKLPDGRVVTRRGPVHFLKKGWREQPFLDFNRRIIGAAEFDISITFRLVKDN